MTSVSETTRLLNPNGQEYSHSHHESDVVWWDSDEDAANPLNWASTQKWSHIAIVSLLTFLVYVFLMTCPRKIMCE